MRGRVSIALALVLAVAVTTATPVQAATTAVGSVHTTDSGFNNAAQLTNVSVTSTGGGAVKYNGSQFKTVRGFESGDLSQWTGSTGAFSVVQSPTFEGSYSLEGGDGDTNGENIETDITDRSYQNFSVAVYDDVLSGANSYPVWSFGTDSGTRIMQVGIDDGTKTGDAGSVVYYDGSYKDTGLDITGSTWYRIEVVPDYANDQYTVNVYNKDGTLKNSSSGIPFTNTGSQFGQITVYDFQDTYHLDDFGYQQPVKKTGTYISANHSVDRATTGWTNLSLDNTTATVTWQGSNGGGWTDVATNTYSSSGNKTQSLSGSYSRWRVNVTFQQDGTNPSGALYDEGVLFSNREPIIDNSSASPAGGTTLQTGDPTLSINVSDPTFPTSQGDKVNVSFYVDGSYIGSSTITSNSTVTQQVNGLTGGSHSWYAIANDSYGGSTTSKTFSFNTPAQLEIRNESQPSKLVDNITTELVFYYKGDPVRIENKSTSDGTVDFTNLPTDRSVVVVADAPDYQPRRIFIDSLIETQKVYLLPKSKQSVTVTFELRDFTGEFPDEPTVLKVQRAINGSWQTVEGDYFGASGSFPTTLRYNVRHRLVLLNTDTGKRRVLGSYTPVATTTEVIVVKNDGSIRVKAGGPLITVDPATRSLRATNSTTIYAQMRNNSYNVSTWNVTATYRNETETTVLAQTNRTTQSGTYEPTLALAGRGGGNVTVVVDYTLADGTTGQKRIVYAVREEYNNSNSLLASVGQIPGRYPAQHVDAVTTFFAVLGSLMMAFGVASVSRASSEIVGLVAIVSLAGFAIIGWVGYGPVFVSSSAWVAMTAIRRGI